MVAIPPQLTLVLREYLKQRRSPRLQHLPYLFVGATARGGVGNEALRRLAKKLRDASGIYFAPHLLRHTYATLMLEGGCDLFSLSKLLKHADIKTTTVHSSVSARHLRRQVLKQPVLI